MTPKYTKKMITLTVTPTQVISVDPFIDLQQSDADAVAAALISESTTTITVTHDSTGIDYTYTGVSVTDNDSDGNNDRMEFTETAGFMELSGGTITITIGTVVTVANLVNAATNTFLSGSSNVASGSGIDFGVAEGSGVLAILGDGSIDFRAQARAIQLRDQGNFVYRSCDNAVILSVDASDLNDNLTLNASWSNNDDKWYPNGVNDFVTDNNTVTNASDSTVADIDLAIKFSDIQSSVGSTQANARITASAGSGIDTYFSNFVDNVKNNLLVDGGEVLFTDETLGQNTFDSTDLLAVIQYSNSTASSSGADMTVVSGSGMDALGSGALSTDNPDATGTNEGSTAIRFESESLKILEVNKMLRRMMDLGYNGRDASSGSGTDSGFGSGGYINDDPFIAGDIFYFPNGFQMDAQVEVDDEILADPRQRASSLSSGTGLSFVNPGTSIVEAYSTHNIDLFIVLK